MALLVLFGGMLAFEMLSRSGPGPGHVVAAAEPAPASKPEDRTVTVADFSEQKERIEGEELKSWMKKNGWGGILGDPAFFFIENGAMHLVARAGPVFKKRHWLAVFNRDKLRHGIENQVVLRMTRKDFRVSTDSYPRLAFKMAPMKLPGKGADILDPDKNDTAFALMIGFDAEKHEYRGVKFTDTVAYVWANRRWEEPTGSDPDYRKFMRYIAIGHGLTRPGEPREIRRNVAEDFRLLFPERDLTEPPDVIRVGLMIDSNTVKGVSHSKLYWVRFEQELDQAVR
jgi:hypothetical protein